MQGKKALFLFLALLLPVSIFIFLKLFGKNEFEVPAFYQDKAPVVAGCDFSYKAPYSLPDSLMSRLSADKRSDVYLIYFSAALSSRIEEEVKYEEVSFIDGKTFQRNDQIRKCVLAIPATEDLVAVDNNGSIRGYYATSDREEVDRLLLELEIMLKKY